MILEMKSADVDKVMVKMKNGSLASTKALRSSVNKVARSVRASGIKRITAEYNIKASDARSSIKLRLATMSKIVAEVDSGTKSISLIYFKPRVTKRGVSYAIRKNGKRQTIEGAFIANQKKKDSGEAIGKAVFKRVAKKRLPIKKQYGPTMAHIFLSLKMVEQLNKEIMNEFPKVYAREYEYYSSK